MPLNDAATLVIGTGNYLTAPVGTAMPTDLLVPGVAWTVVGHTSLEEVMSATSEGGEATVLGTLQNRTLRIAYAKRSETFGVKLQQFDTAGLKLYYGSNATVLVDGSIGVPNNPVPTTVAFLAIFIDGANEFAFYAPKAEILRGDDVDLSGTEVLASLPLSITPLAYQTNSWYYAVTPLGGV